MKRLGYILTIVVLLLLVVNCENLLKSVQFNPSDIADSGSDVVRLLVGSYILGSNVVEVKSDKLIINELSVKEELIAKDPAGTWESTISQGSIEFIFTPSQDIPADQTTFPQRDLIAGQKYPIVIKHDKSGINIKVSSSDILGNLLTHYVASPKTLPELKALVTERIKKEGVQDDFNDIDVSRITDMTQLFLNSKFIGDISQWDVSKVTTMEEMFKDAKFNGDISQWDVSSVTNMKNMFTGNASFTEDISQWDVSNVTNMEFMFFNSTNFNGDISQWDVGNVTTMRYMFMLTPFNQDISGWDVSNVQIMETMFYKTKKFNQDISGWDVSNVTNMAEMFSYAEVFNQDISGWEIQNVTDMTRMFRNSKAMVYNLEAWKNKINPSLKKLFIWQSSALEAAGNVPSWA